MLINDRNMCKPKQQPRNNTNSSVGWTITTKKNSHVWLFFCVTSSTKATQATLLSLSENTTTISHPKRLTSASKTTTSTFIPNESRHKLKGIDF
jgi:hypothetical protein